MTKKFIVVDGNSVFHRAYHAIPYLSTKNGETVNAVYGFSSIILRTIAELKPEKIVVAFDRAAPTFRHIEYEAYKAKRSAPPEDLYPQLPLVKEFLDSSDIKYFELDGYEADDLIATIAKKVERDSDEHIYIVSGDRDGLQLVNSRIRVWAAGSKVTEGIIFDYDKVKERYGVTPDQIITYKSLVGDSSDNIPGVNGIGPKGAADLINRFGDLEGIYENIDQITGGIKQKLIDGKEQAFKARSLVILDKEVPFDFECENIPSEINWDGMHEFFKRLEFKSLVAKLPMGVVKKDDNQTKLI